MKTDIHTKEGNKEIMFVCYLKCSTLTGIYTFVGEVMAPILYMYTCGTKINMPVLSSLLGANRTVLHVTFFIFPNSSTNLFATDSYKEITQQDNQFP